MRVPLTDSAQGRRYPVSRERLSGSGAFREAIRGTRRGRSGSGAEAFRGTKPGAFRELGRRLSGELSRRLSGELSRRLSLPGAGRR